MKRYLWAILFFMLVVVIGSVIGGCGGGGEGSSSQIPSPSPQPSSEMATIYGIIQDNDHMSLQNALVEFESTGAVYQAFSDETGHYSISLPQGSYTIKSYGDDRTRESINANGNTEHNVNPGQGKGTIKCKVKLENNPNAKGALVTIEGLDFAQYTDQSGSFAVTNVPPGFYRMGIQKTGYETVYKTLTVSADQTIDIGEVTLLVTIGTIIGSWNTPSTGPFGITCDGTYLYTSDTVSQKIYKHDLNDPGSTIANINAGYTVGLTYDGSHLWAINSDNQLIQYDTDLNPIGSSVQLASAGLQSIKWVNGKLYCGSKMDNKIYIYDAGFALVDTIQLTHRVSGIEYDPETSSWLIINDHDKQLVVYDNNFANPKTYGFLTNPQNIVIVGSNIYAIDNSDKMIYEVNYK